ncbi:MAG: carbohydrate ABC transporter permease [Chloroflexi bacterium]|nr:carbohydrate ABC transporter permease [Chloroflexota bacterium]MDE2919965.1 carbohydrate ABC transporter permease [Chloroflexota bacterium]MYD94216.1 carbohydrate ABC transporter permease [Chloroflexota bacterium]
MAQQTVTVEPSDPSGMPSSVRIRTPARIRAMRISGRVLTYLILWLGSFVYAIPFLWMVRTSFMRLDKLFEEPPQIWPDPWIWQNYIDMWETGPFANWIVNSLILVALGMFGQTLISIFVAYGFARTQFPGRNQLFVLILASLMLPGHVTIVPKFIMFRTVGLLDSLWPVALPDLWGQAFYIFILRQFFLTLPVELDEAAEIDGANLLQVLFRVVIPLSKPAIATVAVFNFINKWNEFFEPFVFIQTPEKLTLAVGIRWFRTQYGTEFQMLMAASIVSVAPIVIVFFFAQKQFVRGIALTGIKS